jgi:hypothetical protein
LNCVCYIRRVFSTATTIFISHNHLNSLLPPHDFSTKTEDVYTSHQTVARPENEEAPDGNAQGEEIEHAESVEERAAEKDAVREETVVKETTSEDTVRKEIEHVGAEGDDNEHLDGEMQEWGEWEGDWTSVLDDYL